MAIFSFAPAASAGNGNGAPSGPHYNLNLIGLNKGGSDSGGSDGHVIFVPLVGSCKIDLTMGPFQVLQNNCLQGNALFQLPNATGTNGLLAYSVWIRAVTPKGSALMSTCFTDITGTFCNTGSLVVSLSKVTPPKFTDVSKQLLQVCVSGALKPIFSFPANFFWNYTNTGLHLAQLRFYPIQTTPIGGAC